MKVPTLNHLCPDPDPGGTHMLRHTGMCRKNGSGFFAQNTKKKIHNHGSDFHNFNEPRKILKIWCVFVAKSQEMGTFFFWKMKIPKDGYLFLEKISPEHGYGS